MKNRLRELLASGLVAGMLFAILSCASTPTSESTGEYIDNSVITTKVNTALVKSPLVSAMAVDVESFKGIVQLSGFVDNERQKEEAEAIASGIEGVVQVKNNLIVK
jgi:osmotically-inducible protein OsmY